MPDKSVYDQAEAGVNRMHAAFAATRKLFPKAGAKPEPAKPAGNGGVFHHRPEPRQRAPVAPPPPLPPSPWAALVNRVAAPHVHGFPPDEDIALVPELLDAVHTWRGKLAEQYARLDEVAAAYGGPAWRQAVAEDADAQAAGALVEPSQSAVARLVRDEPARIARVTLAAAAASDALDAALHIARTSLPAVAEEQLDGWVRDACTFIKRAVAGRTPAPLHEVEHQVRHVYPRLRGLWNWSLDPEQRYRPARRTVDARIGRVIAENWEAVTSLWGSESGLFAPSAIVNYLPEGGVTEAPQTIAATSGTIVNGRPR